MDLYADLPPAKGDANAAAIDNKSSTSSVWAKGVPAFVPAAAQTKRNAPTVSMLPASLAGPRKSPDAAAGRAAASRGGISLAFRPASVRKPSATSNTSVAFKPSSSNPGTQMGSSSAVSDHAGANGATTGLGFVAATTWTQVTVSQPQTADQSALAGVGELNANTHFFQASYRDEYHPSRPNNYEAFCEERAAKRKMEQVKRDLEKRQRDQDRESKREREQFVKDVNAGTASMLAMPQSAGRGRGMTVPAWMKKKIEESASQPAPQENDSRSVHAGVEEGQFDDAAPRSGLGFTGQETRDVGQAPRQSSRDEFGREVVDHREYGRENSVKSASRDGSSRRRSRSQSPEKNRRSYDRPSTSRQEESRDTGRRTQDQPPSQGHQGRVVLLQNIVGPGEVDDELQEEVKEECSTKYGPVIKCLVYERKGRVHPEEAVRIFVEFQHQHHADLAQKGLNSRFFGGRRVKATYYDEAKFARLELGA